MFDDLPVRPRRRAGRLATTVVQGAADRLDRLAREWLPPPATSGSHGEHPPSTVPVDQSAWDRVLASTAVEIDGVPARPRNRRRVAVADWSPSAMRGLLVLLLVAAALIGWWWWSGRPVAIAVAPTVLSTDAAVYTSHDERSASTSATEVGVPTPPSFSASPATSDGQSGQVVVHVAGLVARPGLVRLPAGSRVADALAAAGGVTKRRAADSVNLARVVADGEQIVVTLAEPVGVGVAMTAGSSAPTPIDLNAASAEQFELLPGVGPVLAGRIVQWRSDNGPFRSVDELGEVSGIGDATLAEIRPHVRV